MKYQRGVSLSGLMAGAVVLGAAALLAMKTVPDWMEYSKIVKAVKATASDSGLREATVAQVKDAYRKRAEIDDIKSVAAEDLEVTKESGQIVISFAYTKKTKLFHNVSVVFDFEGSSAKE